MNEIIKLIENLTLDEERALYNLCDAKVYNVSFDGPLDGESAFKESINCQIDKCYFNLRYPLWHVSRFTLDNSTLTSNSRAPIWYAKDVAITNTLIESVKAIRESEDVIIKNCNINSTEFGWKCKNIKLSDSSIEGEYLFFDSKNILIKDINLKGKYSFQYITGLNIESSNLDTKDAFWHSENVIVNDTIIKGAYLGWYSKNLTLENCTIISTQPFCYCENLKLINCKMIDADLAFEYSSVDATIDGDIMSIKNPLSGTIVCDKVQTLILENSIHKSNATIIERSKQYEKMVS